MPGSSKQGIWVYLDDDMLEDDRPVTTAKSWQLRDNLAHLIDSQCQNRVSWMGTSTSANDHFLLPSSLDAFYAVEFPVTILSTGHLPGLRFNQWMYSGNVANTVTSVLRLRHASDPMFTTLTGTDSTALYSATNTTTSTTGAKKTNYFFNVASRPINDTLARQTFSIEENSDDHTAEVAMVRAEIYMTDSAGNGGGLLGFQVIEFAAWP